MLPTGSLPRRSSVLLLAALTALVTLVVAAVWAGSGSGRPEPPDRTSAAPADPAAPSSSTTPAASAAAGPEGRQPAGRPTGSPTAGSLDPVSYEEVVPRPPVPLTATADFGTGLSVSILEVEAVRSQARSPGEISAPALRLTMRAHNASDRPIALDGMVVSLEYGGARTPAVEVEAPGGAPFTGDLAAGATTRGVYVFNVPPADRGQVRVTTSYTGAAPTVVLAGSMA